MSLRGRLGVGLHDTSYIVLLYGIWFFEYIICLWFSLHCNNVCELMILLYGVGDDDYVKCVY